jgi:hypothetical protein
MEFFNQLEDGWTIYLWLVAGAAIIIASIVAIRWAAKNDQFDEDIKYVVFDESDKEKMSKEDFDKAMQVNKEQEEQRQEVLQREREKKAQNRKAS